eukprot:symbB.v1.2.004475.t4/scaffold249.1/size274694/34
MEKKRLSPDYLRLAQASQLRLSQSELEAVFRNTGERFGSPADSGEPALAFELFVELLVETGRRQETVKQQSCRCNVLLPCGSEAIYRPQGH